MIKRKQTTEIEYFYNIEVDKTLYELSVKKKNKNLTEVSLTSEDLIKARLNFHSTVPASHLPLIADLFSEAVKELWKNPIE